MLLQCLLRKKNKSKKHQAILKLTCKRRKKKPCGKFFRVRPGYTTGCVGWAFEKLCDRHQLTLHKQRQGIAWTSVLTAPGHKYGCFKHETVTHRRHFRYCFYLLYSFALLSTSSFPPPLVSLFPPPFHTLFAISFNVHPSLCLNFSALVFIIATLLRFYINA